MITLPPVISELINRFEQNHQAYHFDPYNETQLRREFVDPFFEALGWDVNNKQGYAEAYKDVIYEDAIKLGGVTKAPDYCFRIGGTRKFFIEAKKPSIRIKEDIGAAFQLRRYAWSAKLSLSILTNFEEFAIYDCRIKPDKADKASNARILYLTSQDYVVLCQGHRGEWKLTTAERKRILLNNIYGVDIDSQAVEVTKLSLLLKVLEGENEQTLSRQLKLFRERALPDLGNNIKCGNSLIGPDYSYGQQLSLLNEDEVYRINAFDWNNEFPEAMKSGGFDAVIGNPPYGAEFQNTTTDYLKNKFNTFVWRGESYLVFVEEGIDLLKLKGLLGYIVPDTYLNLGFTKSLRTFLLQNSKLCEIVNLPSNVFLGGTVDTTLLFTEKAAQVNNFYDTSVLIKLFSKKSSIQSVKNPNREFNISTKFWVEQDAFNIQSELAESKVVSRIDRQNKPLSNFVDLFYGIKAYQVGKGKPPQTKDILENKPFTAFIKKEKTFLPFFDGKHIGRYELLWKNNNWIKYGPWLAEPRQPQKYEGEKILIRKIVGQTLISTYFSETSYCNTLQFVLKIKRGVNLSYHYLLGILNSKFIGWYFRKKFQIGPDDTFPQIMIRDILQFSIPNFDNAGQDQIVALVEQMLSLHKQLADAKTDQEKIILQRQIATTDHQIDHLVYELYKLTGEEIKIVEEAIK
jgi:predicted type IV restriction endonuclease